MPLGASWDKVLEKLPHQKSSKTGVAGFSKKERCVGGSAGVSLVPKPATGAKLVPRRPSRSSFNFV